ncbi:hypothetical protein TRVA0_017S02696 [Trichomonascus vanleenenianus]|uniref:3',5'-cyclic-nucleotide phosphodiesterase PDE1 n=1 Tax=Trichomonascus vanleenenianus TaxID=2268995 RepID=UPI003EC9CE4F
MDVLRTDDGRAAFPDYLHSDLSPETAAWKIIDELIGTVCVTHSHLDHINGVVLNSAAFRADNPKRLAGLATTLDDIRTHVFNGIVWPNLTTEGPFAAGLVELVRLPAVTYVPGLATDLEIAAYPVSHGVLQSTAFFVRSVASGAAIVVWGDVEADSVAAVPSNATVWAEAARLYMSRKLCGVVIECSYPSSHGLPLYGHLTPEHLVEELNTLALMTSSKLEGLSVVVTHIKDYYRGGHQLQQRIYSELIQQAGKSGLQCDFTIARAGMCFYL